MQHASNYQPPGWLTFLLWVLAFSGGIAATVSDAAPSHPRDIVQTVSNPLTGIGHDGEADDGYGYSIAVAGNTALIGVPWDGMTAAFQGSVHVMTKIGDDWQIQAKLVAPDMPEFGLFGTSVAMSGDLALVGANSAPNDAGVRTGAAYVFQRQGEQWHFVQRLIPQNATVNDLFGWKVAINGHTALVSSTKHLDTTSGRIGKVAVFQFDGTSWFESAPWLSDATSNVAFGTALALQGDMALVGSPGNERVDVYERSGSVWQKTRTVVAPDNDPLMTINGFGEALAVDGATAVIGAPDTSKFGEAATGRAFQYDIAQDWSLVRVLSTSMVDAYRFAQNLAIGGDRVLAQSNSFSMNVDGRLHLFSLADGATISELSSGDSDLEPNPVAMSEHEILFGLPSADVLPNGGQGAVARFTEDTANIWSPTDSLNSGNGGYGEGFGHSVAISGDTAVVGMNNGDYGDIAFVSTAHVFERGEQGWVYRSRLVPPDPQRGSLISSYVDIDRDTILLSGDNSQTQSDVCHIFVREDNQWVLQQTIPCAGSAPQSRALSGDRLVIGARFRVDPSGQEGAVDVYHRVAGVWSLEATLRPDNCPESCDFGSAVDIHGDKILVGAVSQAAQNSTHYGAAYLYELGPQGWGMTARWTLPTVGYFATEVALGEHVAVIASRTPPESGVGAWTGAVHVFGDHAGSWQFESEFMGDTSSAGDDFGSALSVDGNALLVGAYSANNQRGTAYLFERSASGWQQSMQFQPAASLPGTPIVFGYAVAMSGSDVLIGIPDYSEPVPWGNALEGAVQFIDSALEYIYNDGFE